MRRRSLLAAAVLVPASLRPVRAAGPTIVVGGKNFTEQQLIAEITEISLNGKGFTVDKRVGLGTAALRAAQEAGQVDVYWEYTGTSLITFNKVRDRLDAIETYARVKELDAAKGLVWLNPSRANNTYALAMRRRDAEGRNIATLSDLAAKVGGGAGLRFGCNAEFYARPDGLGPLEKAYGFQFGRENVVRMDTGLVYQALRDGQVEVGLVFATDGRIPAFDFLVLKDNRNYFPDYALTPVIRKETLDRFPRLADLLNAISGKLDDATMARLNAQVDVDKKPVAAVARGFLEAAGLA